MSASKQLSLNEVLKLIPTCPVCRSKYKIDELAMVYEKDNGHLVHFSCNNCQSKILAYVLENALGITTVALLTDLFQEEMHKFINLKEIDDDYVLNLYKEIENNPEKFTEAIYKISEKSNL